MKMVRTILGPKIPIVISPPNTFKLPTLSPPPTVLIPDDRKKVVEEKFLFMFPPRARRERYSRNLLPSTLDAAVRGDT
jgi:hypothetical protein